MGKIVSVVIPTYNRKKLTDLAIESVVTSFPDLVEIIVVDDCGHLAYSFDAVNSSGVSVCVLRLECNVGPGMARKEGVAQAAGKFIAFLDSDDRYDKGWIDYIIYLFQKESELLNRSVFISGVTRGEKRVAALARKVLVSCPTHLQLVAARLIVIMFNSFYTPSLVLSRDLCVFKEELRHCEDYYTTTFALFMADKILIPPVVSCYLGRIVNSRGGESAEREKMNRGEMRVRYAMLREAGIPLGYKLLVPIGMMYQKCRSIVKRVFSIGP